MMISRYLLALLAISFSYQSFALNLNSTNQSMSNELYDNRSCNELYVQASTLEQDTFLNKNNIYNDRKTQIASYASTVFSPAIYYFGFNVFQNYKNQARSEQALYEIDRIRLRMAEKRCFEKQ